MKHRSLSQFVAYSLTLLTPVLCPFVTLADTPPRTFPSPAVFNNAPAFFRDIFWIGHEGSTGWLATDIGQNASPFDLSDQNTLGEIVGIPWTGDMGITETVEQIQERANTYPIDPGIRVRLHEPHNFDRLLMNPASPYVSQFPPLDEGQTGSPFLPQLIGADFNTTSRADTGWMPPDTMGAVGPSQFLTVINGRVRVHPKTGGAYSFDGTLDAFFAPVRGTVSVGDPYVCYDRLSQRWFVSCITLETPNKVCLAVSSGPVITNQTSFTFFSFRHDLLPPTPNTDTNGLCDYPSLGVDANGVYIGANIFAGGFVGSSGYVIRKSSVLGPGPIVVTALRQMGPSGGPGPGAPRGVTNDDPTATQGLFVGLDLQQSGRLAFRRVLNPAGTPTLSPNYFVTVPTTASPGSLRPLGSNLPLSLVDARLFAAGLFKNHLNGARTLWTAHHMRMTSTGVANNSGGRIGARWYQVADVFGTPSLVQSGSVFDSAATSPTSYFFPSVAMSGQGHAVIGFSFASPIQYIGAAVAGRLSNDAGGTMSPPTVITPGVAAYNLQRPPSGSQRWGDYSFTSVDPNDGQTIWTIQEYCNFTDSWAVRATQLVAPPPATPTSVDSSVARGAANVPVTVTGASVAGSGFFDPDATYPNRISATVGGAGVTVNSIAFLDPTHITLNVSAAANAALGSRTITVTNPDGQSVTSAAILNVTAPPTVAFTGTVKLDGWIGSATPISGLLVRLSIDGAPEVSTSLNGTGNTGTFAADLPSSGQHTVRVRPLGFLSQTATVTTNSAPVSFDFFGPTGSGLVPGDSDSNNTIDDADLTVMLLDYGTGGGISGATDLNGDSSVDDVDLTLLLLGFGLTGN